MKLGLKLSNSDSAHNFASDWWFFSSKGSFQTDIRKINCFVSMKRGLKLSDLEASKPSYVKMCFSFRILAQKMRLQSARRLKIDSAY